MINKRPFWNEEYCSCSYIDECDYCKAFGELVEEIEKKERAKNIKPMCLICLKELAYLYLDFLEGGLHSYQTSPMDDANDFLIYGGYGSRHDDEIVKAFICDDCFESRKKMSIFYKVERSNNENR